MHQLWFNQVILTQPMIFASLIHINTTIFSILSLFDEKKRYWEELGEDMSFGINSQPVTIIFSVDGGPVLVLLDDASSCP